MTPPWHCPVCRATLGEGHKCRRCKTDLTLLLELEGQREALVRAYWLRANRGDWRQALSLAQGIQALRRGPDGRRMLALACLMQHHFPAAWQLLQEEEKTHPHGAETL